MKFVGLAWNLSCMALGLVSIGSREIVVADGMDNMSRTLFPIRDFHWQREFLKSSFRKNIDFATRYMQHILGFIGITDIELIAAEQFMMEEEAKLASAQKLIEAA